MFRPRLLRNAAHTADAIRNIKQQRNITKLRCFQGLCNVFQPFVSNFVHFAAPLNCELRKGQPRKFVRLNKKDFTEIVTVQQKTISTFILALPYAGGQPMLYTDIFNVQVGCVLLKEQPDTTKRPNGYRSWSLTNAKQAYDTTQQES